MNHTDIEEREQEALNSLEDAKERIKQLEEDVRFWKGEYEAGVGRVQIVERDLANAQRDLADMTKLAVDYKGANTRLEDDLREFHAKDWGRTREHNLLVQENRKLHAALEARLCCEPDGAPDHNFRYCKQCLSDLDLLYGKLPR